MLSIPLLCAALAALMLPLARVRAGAIRLRVERRRPEGWREPRQPWG